MTDSRIYSYRVSTLVDITNTNVTRFCAELEHQRNQQRNFESVIQILGLRTQIIRISRICTSEKNINDCQFGDAYTGQHKIWVLDFDVEYQDIYKIGNDPFRVLVDDFSQVPINVNLDETAEFPIPLFYTDGKYKNIYFNLL